MEVVYYEEPEHWFLLEEDERLFMDVHYSEGFADIPRMFELNDAERTGYAQEGLPFLSRLASRAQDASADEFRPRNLPQFWHDKGYNAIMAWRTANGTLIAMPPVEVLSISELFAKPSDS